MSDLRVKLIEAGADGLYARIGYDTIEVRNWGEEPMADAGRLLAAQCLDAFLDCLADELDERDRWSDIVAALGRGDTDE